MEKRDGNGMTEAEFLAAYAKKSYPKPSLTADIVVRSCREGVEQVLLVRRGQHPFLDCWALPGGFANPNEPLEDTAARELREETGVEGLALTPVGLFSAPGRDPRGWVVSQAYQARVDWGVLRPQAGDDAAQTQWFSVECQGKTVELRCRGSVIRFRLGQDAQGHPQAEALTPERLAFDHALILARALGI